MFGSTTGFTALNIAFSRLSVCRDGTGRVGKKKKKNQEKGIGQVGVPPHYPSLCLTFFLFLPQFYSLWPTESLEQASLNMNATDTSMIVKVSGQSGFWVKWFPPNLSSLLLLLVMITNTRNKEIWNQIRLKAFDLKSILKYDVIWSIDC